MLNELMQLSKTLAQYNIKQDEWDKNYSLLPSSKSYRTWLNNDGSIVKIEVMDKELADQCRKYVWGSNCSFPAFNIAPLYSVSSDEQRAYCKDVTKGRAEFDPSRIQQMQLDDFWDGKLLKKIKNCFESKLVNIPEDSAIFALMKIVRKLDPQDFRKDLENYVWSNLQHDFQTLLPLFVFDGSSNKSVSVFFDLDDWQSFDNPIASQATTKQINEWLVECDQTSNNTETDSIDAYGTPFKQVSDSMPVVRLYPGFDAKLRSMFSEQRCQYRYNKADDNSFPISMNNRNMAKKALEWISKPDNKGRTWSKVDNGEVLFTYPDKLPDVLPHFAWMMGGVDVQGKQFVEISNQVIDALKGIPPIDKPQNIQLFVLEQVTPASSNRARVVYTRNLSVQGLLDAATNWQQGCKNLPDFAFIKAETPFPLHACQCANMIWKQDGVRADGKSKVKVARSYDGLRLLLDEMNCWQLGKIVRALTVNWQGLVMFFGNNELRKKGASPIIKRTQIEQMNSFVSLLGLLLFKNKIKKEDYMQDAPYLLGQMLKVSNRLHALYCEVKRDGEVPPQLVGNSFFAMASEMPIKALGVLGTRMQPYLAWAEQCVHQKKTGGDDKGGLANWYYRLYEKLSTLLCTTLTEDTKFGDWERAQLFLGYLAKLPSTKNNQTSQEEENKDE